MIKPVTVRSDYLGSVYRLPTFHDTVEATIRTAKDMMKKSKYDTIVFTGYSGSALAYILSKELNIPLICVRKSNERSHFVNDGSGLLEGSLDCQRYIIVDDFIASGRTVRRISEVMEDGMPTAKCVGILLYTAQQANHKLLYGHGGKLMNVRVCTNHDYFLSNQK